MIAAALTAATAVGSRVMAAAARGSAAEKAPSPNVETPTATHTAPSPRLGADEASCSSRVAVNVFSF